MNNTVSRFAIPNNLVSDSTLPRSAVQNALKLAYQWDALTCLAAREGLDQVQTLGLERLLEIAGKNELDLGCWLDEAHIPRPKLTRTNWLDVLVAISRKHPGVQALAEAAMLEPGLQALAHQLRDSSRAYREISLNALARVETVQ